MSSIAEIRIIDRNSNKIVTERVLGERFIRFAYQTASSPLLHKILFRSALFSRILGRWYNSPGSCRKIPYVIQELKIDMTECAETVFPSFNAFFARRLKPECRPFDPSPEIIVSPADGRLLAFPDSSGSFMPVKGYQISVSELLHLPTDETFQPGPAIIVRLCPADYHRYHFPTDGSILRQWTINGAYHSVNPIALSTGIRVMEGNRRSCTLASSPIGRYVFLEVGAFGVGAIHDTHPDRKFEKMDEKGYFTFGGSTVILVFEQGTVQLADDLVLNSSRGFETLVRVGETIARANRKKEE